jgi:hypothetical protein
MSPGPDDGAGYAEITAIVERAGRDVALVEEIAAFTARLKHMRERRTRPNRARPPFNNLPAF